MRNVEARRIAQARPLFAEDFLAILDESLLEGAVDHVRA